MPVSQDLGNAASFQAYVRDFAPELISKTFHGAPTAQSATPHEGVKGELVVTELTLGQMNQRYKNTFDPIANTIGYKPRKITTKRAKIDIQFCPGDYESTYLGIHRRKGQNDADLIFEGYTLNKVIEKHLKEKEFSMWQAIEDLTPDDGDPLHELFNGYNKIIVDEITPSAIPVYAVPGGAWTQANIIAGFETMYDNLNDDLKQNSVEVEFNMSHRLRTMFNRAWRDAYGKYLGFDEQGRMKLDFANAYLTARPGLTGSNRVTLTPPENLHYAYDVSEDEMFEFEKNKRLLDAWMTYRIGVEFGITTGGYIVTCDLA